jgi:hypothetical protein
MISHVRERVFVITTEDGDDLIVGYGIKLREPDSIASLILQRSPKFEHLLPPEERGVAVSYELHPSEDRQVLQSVSIKGVEVNIVTNAHVYRLDLSDVDAEESEEAVAVLKRMHGYGGFALRLR